MEIKSAWTVQPVPTAHSKITSRRPGRDARGAQEAPSWTQDAFKKCVQETPSCAQEAPKTDQVRLKFAPRGSKLDPKHTQERFGHILEAIWTLNIRLVRTCLAQEASKRCPRGSKVEPKRRPRGSKLSPRCLQELQVETKKASKKARRAAKRQSNNTSTAQKAKNLDF